MRPTQRKAPGPSDNDRGGNQAESRWHGSTRHSWRRVRPRWDLRRPRPPGWAGVQLGRRTTVMPTRFATWLTRGTRFLPADFVAWLEGGKT